MNNPFEIGKLYHDTSDTEKAIVISEPWIFCRWDCTTCGQDIYAVTTVAFPPIYSEEVRRDRIIYCKSPKCKDYETTWVVCA